MNWLSIVVLAFLLFMVINGFRRGFVRTVISMVSIIIAIALVYLLSPHVSEFLEKKTPLYQKVQKVCEDQMEKYTDQKQDIDGNTEDQLSVIDKLPLPDSLKNSLLLNNTAEGYSQLVVGTFSEYLSVYLAHMIVQGIASILSFVLAIFIIRLLTFALDSVAQLPVLSSINRIGGGVAGAVQGILTIWVIFLVVTILCNFDTSWGKDLYQIIQKDPFLSFLYNTNLLLGYMKGFIG